MRLRANYKVWLELENGKPVAGPGVIAMLRALDETKSFTRASRKLGISFRYLWGRIREAERVLGVKLVETYRGGSRHGGAELTPTARALIEAYSSLEEEVRRAIASWEQRMAETLKAIGAGKK